jgi:hypothetical protein
MEIPIALYMTVGQEKLYFDFKDSFKILYARLISKHSVDIPLIECGIHT